MRKTPKTSKYMAYINTAPIGFKQNLKNHSTCLVCHRLGSGHLSSSLQQTDCTENFINEPIFKLSINAFQKGLPLLSLLSPADYAREIGEQPKTAPAFRRIGSSKT